MLQVEIHGCGLELTILHEVERPWVFTILKGKRKYMTVPQNGILFVGLLSHVFYPTTSGVFG